MARKKHIDAAGEGAAEAPLPERTVMPSEQGGEKAWQDGDTSFLEKELREGQINRRPGERKLRAGGGSGIGAVRRARSSQ